MTELSGNLDGFSTNISSPLVNITSYTTEGAVAINSKLYSLSNLS